MLNAKIKTETVLSHCLTPQDWCVRIGSVMPFRVVLNLLQIAVYLTSKKIKPYIAVNLLVQSFQPKWWK